MFLLNINSPPKELVPGSPVKMYGVGLAQRMRDIIDVDAGPVISGEKTGDEMGDAILEFLIPVVSGEIRTKAEMLSQDDFIPWKRGVSL